MAVVAVQPNGDNLFGGGRREQIAVRLYSRHSGVIAREVEQPLLIIQLIGAIFPLHHKSEEVR